MIWLLTLAAFGLRAVIGWLRPGDIADSGYSLFIELAQSFISGHGLCLAQGDGCAMRVPIYPLFLTPFVAATAWHALIVAQAAVGALQVPVVAMLGRTLFDRRVAQWAALAVAFNPYALIHDTALQDTVLFNLLAMVAIALTIEARRHATDRWWIVAGVALSLATLTSLRFALFLPCSIAWVLLVGGGDRIRKAAMVGLPIVALLGGWVVRNWVIVGAPVLTTESGRQLWEANHPALTEFLPAQSIDVARGMFLSRLSRDQLAAIETAGGEVDRDRVFLRMSLDRVRREPIAVAATSVLKVAYALSGYLSPARGAAVQAGFALIFAPVSLLSLIGVWRFRARSPDHALIALVFLSFIVTTAIFWAHTSHVSYLHGLQFIYAAAVVASITTRPASGGGAYRSPAS